MNSLSQQDHEIMLRMDIIAITSSAALDNNHRIQYLDSIREKYNIRGNSEHCIIQLRNKIEVINGS